MKNKITQILFGIFFLGIIQIVQAQAPTKFTFQAIIKNASQAPIISSNVGLQISILPSAIGASVYSERHTATTNVNGLATVIVGNGFSQTGNFLNIAWNSGSYFIKVEVDPTGGTNYSISNTTQLLSVPYALHANELDPQVSSTLNNNFPKWNGTTLVDSQLYDNGTSVGIGTNTPSAKLDVSGNIRATTIQLTTNPVNGYFLKSDASGNTTWAPELDPKVQVNLLNTVPRWGASNYLENGIITDNGSNVGIANTNPTEKLDVFGNVKAHQFIMTTGATTGYVMRSNATGTASWADPNTFSEVSSTLNQRVPKWNGSALVDGIIQDNGIGIGINTSPVVGNDLTLAGKASVANLQISNGAAANSILRSDATGNASWVNPSTVEVDPQVATSVNNIISKWNGTSLVDSQIIDNGTNVGVGIDTPTEKFQVSGGNLLVDDNVVTVRTRKIMVGGARPDPGTTYAQLDFKNLDGGLGYTGATIGSQNDTGINAGDLRFSTNSNGSTLTPTTRMIITSDGDVGIGTTNPTQAKLVINGSQAQTYTSYGYLNRTTPTGTFNGSATNDYSIYASDRIAAPEFNAFSDERIKNIIGVSNKKEDLKTLLNIEITDYKLKDSIAKGNKNYKKVIAQQVEKVFPQAVSTMTDVIPDIYKNAEMKNGFIAIKNNLKAGEKVKLIKASGDEIVEVLKVNQNGFKINSNKSEEVFVYGRQVNDFHTVDYEALATLNISATQELFNEIQKLKTENTSLKAEMNTMAEVKKDVELLKSILYNTSTSAKNEVSSAKN